MANQLLNGTTAESSNKPQKNGMRLPYQSTIQQLRHPTSIKSHNLQYNTKHEVLLSDVQDGPLKFNVQLLDYAQDLETLMSNLENLSRKPISNPLFSGDACLALHSQSNSLRRAIVSQVINSDEVEVLYCDFGDREVVQHSRTYEIPPQYLNPKALSIAFTLSGISGLDVTHEMKKYFKELVLGKKLTLIVKPPENSPLVHYGELFIENTSVLEILLKFFPGSGIKFPDAPRLTPGARESCHVSYIDSCSKFFVHLDKNILDISFLSNHLQECNKATVLIKEILKPGINCLAQSSADSVWYRAKVLSISDNHVTVHYVDYGNDESIPCNAIRSICCNEIIKIPIQAVYCILNESVSMNSEIDDKFYNSVVDKSLEMVVCDIKTSGIVVDLYDSTVQPILNISATLSPQTITTVNGSSNQNHSGENQPNGFDHYNSHDNTELPKQQDLSTMDFAYEFFPKSTSPTLQISLPNIALGAKKHCEVVWITSPTDFYIQLKPDNSELNSIMSKIAQVYETGGNYLSKSNCQVGKNCVAQFSEDLQWYRVAIESIDSNGVTVRFVDYGNIETVTYDKIKELDAQFAELPVQAINCKLSAASKTTWEDNEITEFTSYTAGKLLEVEFITQENNVYEVLVREVVDNEAVGPYLNEIFSNGADFMQIKQSMKNKAVTADSSTNHAIPEQKWSKMEQDINLPTEEDVVVTWVTDPDDFYCQLLDKSQDFNFMMEEIQKMYSQRQPIQDNLAVGSSVIAVFTDGLFYRAEVIAATESEACVVRYVDFGNIATVKLSEIYPIDEKLIDFPKQAIPCCLKNIVPQKIRWSNSNLDEINRFFYVERLRCNFLEKNNGKYFVSLTYNGQDLADTLVRKGLAVAVKSTETKETVEGSSPMDTSILYRQILQVKVLKVESVNKFTIELPHAKASEAVTSNVSCSLKVDSSPTLDDTLRNLIENKEVIIRVDKINNNRLIVELFDEDGNKVELQKESVSPLCPMPIFSNKYSVTVPHVNNLKSIWLARHDDIDILTTLQNELHEYYSNHGELLKIGVGILCAALSFDGNWYRARIINKTNSGAIVHYLDFGNTEEVSSDKLKELSQKFLKPFQLAIEVQLTFNLDDEVKKQEILYTHILDQSFDAILQFNAENKWTASLSLKSGDPLENHLCKLGLLSQDVSH